MFLKKSTTTIRGKTYHSYKVVESYRDKGKVKHRILFPLGTLTDEQAEQIRMALRAHSDPNVVVSKIHDIVVTNHWSYLDLAVLHHLWKDWDLDRFFQGQDWVKPLVLNRAADPVTKINIKGWIKQTILLALLDKDLLNRDEFDVYRTLDHLDGRQSELQSFLYKQIQTKFPTLERAFFYDITSTYFEGSRCLIAKLGYSRDHRPDRKQIAIALMVTPEGYPFYWRVFPGNTQDVTTIEDLIADIRQRFNIPKCTLIFDRGMVSAANLDAIRESGWEYVSAMDRDEIGTLDFLDTSLPEAATPDNYDQIMAMHGFEPYDDNQFLFYREFVRNARRYILTFDVARFHDEYRRHVNQFQALTDWVAQKNLELANVKKARRKDALEKQIQQRLKKHGAKKFTDIEIHPRSITVTNKKGKERSVETFRLSLEVDEAAREREQKLFGLTCFMTNVSRYSPKEIIHWYRRKNKVEEAFQEIKTRLDLRPVYLSRQPRVTAHVTLCVLAYFLHNDMEYRLKKNDGITTRATQILKKLKTCQINQISFKSINRSELSITEPTEEQEQLLIALNCKKTIEPKEVKKLLKKMKNLV